MTMMPSTQFGGYELVSRLSGWRELFIARERDRKGFVTLELLPRSAFPDDASRARVERELALLGSLTDPGLWKVRACLRDELALVTERVRLPRLCDRLQRRPMPKIAVKELAVRIARLLRRAHGVHVLFGGLCPFDVWSLDIF